MPSRNKLALAALIGLAGCAGPRIYSDTPVKLGGPYQVRGRWYVPADDRTYSAVGYASWYGHEHGGNNTASGERFEAKRISAAHTTLPLPSYVEVTCLDTGRRMIVRVNDRGPFSSQRLIDLSQAAADRLGMRRAGTTPVAVQRVFPSEADRRRLRAGRPASELPDARADEIAALRARLTNSATASASLSQMSQY
ncbi:MAG: septal ring lytic transglycosylase RlpA family protein [Sphingomonadaceae bacterium]|nr:septal ring lytic transglycosylase RlpA family protein [Sphingomonadaceae bacterium]